MSRCRPGRTSALRSLGMLVMLCVPAACPAQEEGVFARPGARAAYVQQAAQRARAEKVEAMAWARVRGVPVRVDDGNRLMELMFLRDGRPVYNVTHNANAAISTAADLVRDTAPFNVDGAGHTAGVWDGGAVLSTHQEFGGRVNVMDGASSHYHATHVGGTVGAAGVVAAAEGMAPSVTIDSYDWTDDSSEMAARAASMPGEAGKIHVSNHSYGHACGWVWANWATTNTFAWHWSATWGAGEEEPAFGQYDSTARTYDEVVYNAPYYLPFKAAGNDRNDGPPNGSTVYYSTNGGSSWNSTTYDNAVDPPGDGVYRSGYDTIPHRGVAKNVLTVGAVNDAVSGGSRSLGAAGMASFSGWGPADDGRIKPDIVANGISLYSCDHDSNTDYATRQGTSMSTPNASGSAMLLVDYYGDLFAGGAMRASTLKGLILHTADDLGNTGPDYTYGWGLMNALAAAQLIEAHHQEADTNPRLIEGQLSVANASDDYMFTWNGSDPIRVTLCWTDPPGTSTTNHDSTAPILVNDLDLVVEGPGGSPTYRPYVLDRASPSVAATTGENDVDNVEQVYIASPSAGSYTVQVDYDGSLTDDLQWYSVVISGSALDVAPVSSFAATSVSTSRIDLAWVKNASNDNVVVAYNTVNSFGTPTDGTTYGIGASIGDATVIYNGGSTVHQHTGLDADTRHYYQAWSVNGAATYSAETAADAKTPSPPADAHQIAASAGPHGSISPSGSISVAHGGSTNLTVTADPGHYIWSVRQDGANVAVFGQGDTSYVHTVSNVTTDHTVVATFETNAVARHWSEHYLPGTNTISCDFTYPTNRQLLSLKWEWAPSLPTGWTPGTASGHGDPLVTNGNEIVFTGVLTNNPIEFTYTVIVPPGETGGNEIRADVEYQLAGAINPSGADVLPDPLPMRRLLTLSSVVAENKTYDGSSSATVSSYGALETVAAGDDVTLDTSGAVATFSDAAVATGKTVTVTGLALSGADAGDYAIEGQATTADISAKELTVTGAVADDKVYDGTTDATISGATLVGVVGGDDVLLDALVGTFAQADVGTDIAVTAALTLTGVDTGNYSLMQPAGLTADITTLGLTIGGSFTALHKVYDGEVSATIDTNNLTLVTPVGGDDVSLNAVAVFGDETVGADKTVSLTGSSVGGADAGNYTLSLAGAPTATADITSLGLAVGGSFTAHDKVYDGGVGAAVDDNSLTLVTPVAGDDVSLNAVAVFGDKTVGADKTVSLTGSSLGGVDAANYTLSLVGAPTTTADITARELTVTGAVADEKVYDGTTDADMSGATLVGVVGGDDVSLDALAGTFAQADVGTDIAVTAALTLTGVDTGNYSLMQPAGLAADITALGLSVGGSFTAQDKVYDGGVGATIDDNSLTLVTPVGGDDVSLNAAAEFADAAVGMDKAVSLTGSSLAGADADNYMLSLVGAPTSTADITARMFDLSVASEHGTTLPGTGSHTFTNGSVLACAVTDSPVSGGTGVLYVCTGVAVAGNRFTEASPTNLTLVLTNDAVVTWLWDTNYWLDMQAEGHGSVSPTDMWVRAGSFVEATADPDEGYVFDGWSGSGTNSIVGGAIHAATVTVVVAEPVSLTAGFVLGVADFEVTSLSASDGTVSLRWQGSNIWCTVRWASNLTGAAWHEIDDGTPWPIRGGQWSGSASTDHPHVFYRVLAE